MKIWSEYLWWNLTSFQVMSSSELKWSWSLSIIPITFVSDLEMCVSFSDYRRVIHAGQLFDVVHHLHTDSSKNTHCGYRPVYERSKHEYFGIPRSYIRLHCKYCPGCVAELTSMKPRQPHKQVITIGSVTMKMMLSDAVLIVTNVSYGDWRTYEKKFIGFRELENNI